MLEKEPTGNQVSPLSPVTPGLQPAQSHPNPRTAIGTHGGPRPGAGRPKGVPNKGVSLTFINPASGGIGIRLHGLGAELVQGPLAGLMQVS
jgi:hypothetical protein